MGKIRFRFNPFSLGAIALICAAIFGYLACEALRSQYFERGAGKSYFIDNKDFHPSQLDDQGLRMVIKANKIFSFRKDGEFHFGVYKYRQTASASPDGVIATIYADGEPIALALRNPYADKSAPYIDDGFADIVNISFNIPKAAKEIVVEFSQNKNSDLDIVEPVKLKIHKANALGCAIAVIALLGFIASLIGLIYFALKRYSSAAFAVDLRAYFNNEKTALLIYRAAIAVLIICAAYGIMVSAGFTFNQEGRFHIPISLDDFFLYHAPRSDGRFFPLANTDYNLLWFLPYGFSAQGFYFINLITFIATIWAMVYLIAQSDRDKTTSRYINAFLLIVILLSLNRSIRAFMEIIYPERLLAVTIVAFMIFYKKALDSDKIAWFGAALLTAVYATYQKEPMFGVFIVFAVFSLLFMPKTKKQTTFNIALIINGAVFLLIYYFTTIAITERSYASGRALYEPSEYAAFFAQNWLIIILFVFSAIRGWYLIAKKDRSRLFYDATLFAACAFVCAYLVLGFVKLPRAYYYYAPAAFMFAPALIYWSKYLYFNKRYALFWTIVIALLLSCRVFSLDSAVEARRNNHDFVVALSAYERLGKRVILIDENKQFNAQTQDFMNLVKYINSKTYTLDTARSVNIALNSPDDLIDYNAVYIFLGDDFIVRYSSRFAGFRPILKARSSFSSFTAYIYDK